MTTQGKALDHPGASAQAWAALRERRWDAAGRGFAMAAEQGDPEAALGQALLIWTGRARGDARQALQAAADAGAPAAVHALGVALLAQDRPAAIGHFRRAADQGYAPSMARLSEAAPAASPEARAWAERGAALGEPACMARLGRLLADTPMRKEALAWLYAAAALGAGADAARDARSLAHLMIARDIADGQKRGRALVKQFKAAKPARG
ncbi:MAG: hypothetical protein GC189_14390 [Alphaproteobacteria bacterium]|nr:hypothetical protein [Alphaproteobacteria bacterium]